MEHLRIDIECCTLLPSDLVVKIYAEGHIGRLAQETIHPRDAIVQLNLKDQPSFVCVALVCRMTGETLDEKIFKEGVPSLEPDVVVETREPEIEQLLS